MFHLVSFPQEATAVRGNPEPLGAPVVAGVILRWRGKGAFLGEALGGPNWSLHVQHAVIDVNIRLAKIHGCTPAELLLRFNPMSSRNGDGSARGVVARE